MSTKPSAFPSTPAWLSAVLLHVFYRAWAVGMGVVVMFLIELMKKEPRLAVAGGLLAWLSPVVLIALGHRLAHGVLDRADKKENASRGTSLFAGLYGWFVMWFSTSMTVFAVLLVHPPEPQPDALAQALGAASGGWEIASLQTAVWLVVAALLFQAERVAKSRG